MLSERATLSNPTCNVGLAQRNTIGVPEARALKQKKSVAQEILFSYFYTILNKELSVFLSKRNIFMMLLLISYIVNYHIFVTYTIRNSRIFPTPTLPFWKCRIAF